jgi:hypothetical protein
MSKCPPEVQDQYWQWRESKQMPFGSHKGQTARYVFDYDRSYFKWCMQQPWFWINFPTFLDVLVRMFQEVGEQSGRWNK